jgi:two-component system, CAI-1 autoinducer sensor kinase/phosphatase CqsS
MATILLIDDDPHCVLLTQKLLSMHGHTVLVAKNGMIGLRMAREIKADIVLLDLNLPDIPGIAVISRLRTTAKFSSVPIVAFTADTTEKTRRLIISVGYDGMITKPIDYFNFPDQVQEFINKGSIQAQHEQRIAANVG